MLAWLRLLFTLSALQPVPVPAGRYFAGASPHETTGLDATQDDEPRGHLAYVAAFSMDATEVTRSAYAACVLAGACPRREVALDDLVSSLPMVDVSWREAAAYCAASRARLPTEREWERAARGSADARRYPWGDEPECARGNWGNYEGEGHCPGNPGHPVAVGSYPPYAGLYDLAGNVWEWTADAYPAPGATRGPEELGIAPRRSVRGGACCSILAAPRVDNRVGWPEDYRDGDLGFRCVR